MKLVVIIGVLVLSAVAMPTHTSRTPASTTRNPENAHATPHIEVRQFHDSFPTFQPPLIQPPLIQPPLIQPPLILPPLIQPPLIQPPPILGRSERLAKATEIARMDTFMGKRNEDLPATTTESGDIFTRTYQQGSSILTRVETMAPGCHDGEVAIKDLNRCHGLPLPTTWGTGITYHATTG